MDICPTVCAGYFPGAGLFNHSESTVPVGRWHGARRSSTVSVTGCFGQGCAGGRQRRD